ncbi:S41 family peptidase [Flavobacterium nitrogenifigens]|uniref:C-terminal processing protease CtpA/Prc, contains a PDZ domain n=1 Tax=Flavobacterium nitrogenifigens TaxID=1617283 RepID=A0A521CI72_9FLAO|nr:S41 family peptidase [Flavobacterium nitrogenifigens]KAF2338932.1 peptidase S41 [Flavobacterium nitrogenifigens]SMO59149.1 C-terminal processing protease CtpA/Prc, contains a PDZ domain [Flavobacterium nitrogenifigens]
MKKTVLIVFLLLFQFSFSKPITETQKLAATCKVWGFLKYYHPNVTDGSKNWDEQLFQILPKIEETKTDAEFSKVIEKWINSLGKVKAYEAEISNEEVDYFDKNLDLSWTQDTLLFSKSLCQKLKFIEQNRIQGKQYYVEKGIEFKNEVEYAEFKDKDKNFRLLLLFRFWNYVEYFFPYKYQMDQKWDLTLLEFLPRTINPISQDDYYLSLKEVSAKLNDTHALFGANKIFDFFGRHGISFDVKIIDDKAIVTGFKNESLSKINDIRIGDVITKIDGKAIGDLIKENIKYIEGSNYAAILNNEYPIFYGRTDTSKIEFVRNDKTAIKTIKRYLYKDLNINYENNSEKYKLLENNIGYVNMAVLTTEDVSAMMEKFKDCKSIIFDIRNYPQGTNFAIAEYLNPEPRDFVKSIDADLSYPGRYIWRKEETPCGKTNPDYYKGNVILLVNEKSISHSEFTAMTLKVAPKSIVIGSQTAGSDGANYRFEIIKGIWTSFTTYGVFYPDKKEVQRIGIVPDIEVKPTILGIQQGKDEVLERAVLFAKNGK